MINLSSLCISVYYTLCQTNTFPAFLLPMVNMDSGLPPVRRFKPTKKDLERLKKGGKEAQKIHNMAEEQHRSQEIPEAEKNLENELKEV